MDELREVLATRFSERRVLPKKKEELGGVSRWWCFSRKGDNLGSKKRSVKQNASPQPQAQGISSTKNPRRKTRSGGGRWWLKWKEGG